MQTFDDFEIDLRIAAANRAGQIVRDRDTKRVLFLVPAMGAILAAEPVALADRAACRAALLPFYDGAIIDLDANLDDAIVWARGLIANQKDAA